MRGGPPADPVPGAFFATTTLLAAIGDARVVLAGPITGARRLARHLWRMCFARFIASGSFFLGQMNFVPESVRKLPLLLALGDFPAVLPDLLDVARAVAEAAAGHGPANVSGDRRVTKRQL
jgi:hypothetical protein